MPTSNGPARLAIPRRIPRPTLRLAWPATRGPVVHDGRLAALAEAELAQYHVLPTATRRRDWLAGRLAAKLVVREVMRRRGTLPPLRSIVIANDESGAPAFLVDGSSDAELGLNLSLAHADGVGFAAVAETTRCGSVGVDVEPDHPLSASRLRAVLTRREWRALQAGDPTDMPSPLALWTLKEAVFKADRGETFISPRHVELRWRAGRVRVRWPAAQAAPPRFRLSWRTHRGFAIACVIRSTPETS